VTWAVTGDGDDDAGFNHRCVEPLDDVALLRRPKRRRCQGSEHVADSTRTFLTPDRLNGGVEDDAQEARWQGLSADAFR
jgi:hypothetical protein